MAYREPDQRKARDRERFRQRSEKRIARGLCPRCGDRPPEPERSLCGPCAARRNRAGRPRDARLRAEGKPLRDPASARAAERRRARRQADRRHHAGLCVRCGTAPAAAGRRSCEPCLEKRREADRARYRAGKEAGALYGGANVEVKRHSARVASRKRQKARREARLCIRCGKGSLSRGEPHVRHAAKSARRRRDSNMPSGGPPAAAQGAADRSMTAIRAALYARSSTRPAVAPNARMRSPGRGMPPGKPRAGVRPAEPHPKEPRGVLRAPRNPTTARSISRVSRSGTRAGPCSSWHPAGSTARSTAKPTYVSASPSRSSPGTRWRS